MKQHIAAHLVVNLKLMISLKPRIIGIRFIIRGNMRRRVRGTRGGWDSWLEWIGIVRKDKYG
jgi:hypothetical protein